MGGPYLHSHKRFCGVVFNKGRVNQLLLSLSRNTGTLTPRPIYSVLLCIFNHALLMFMHMALWPRIQRVPGSIREVKQPMREVDHSPASSAEVMYRWSCNSAPLICLHFVERNKFTFSREWAMNRSLPASCPLLRILYIRSYPFGIWRQNWGRTAP